VPESAHVLTETAVQATIPVVCTTGRKTEGGN